MNFVKTERYKKFKKNQFLSALPHISTTERVPPYLAVAAKLNPPESKFDSWRTSGIISIYLGSDNESESFHKTMLDRLSCSDVCLDACLRREDVTPLTLSESIVLCVSYYWTCHYI